MVNSNKSKFQNEHELEETIMIDRRYNMYQINLPLFLGLSLANSTLF